MRLILAYADSALNVFLQRGDDLERLDQPFLFRSPMSSADLEGLTWYLEEYPRIAGPSGHLRARQIETRLVVWGHSLFDSIFPVASAAREAWRDLRAELQELWFTSSSTGFLALPWELLSDPSDRGAFDRLGIIRLPEIPVERIPDVVLRRPRRVLVVISRPVGTPDIAYRLFAGDLVEKLGQRHKDTQIEVLRPPTYKAFQQFLKTAADRGQPLDIVHFDGHGSIEPAPAGGSSPPEAALVFETESGSRSAIRSSRLVKDLQGIHVPLFVLAACHSGTVSNASDSESALAAALVRGGIATAAVSMSHAIFADAARIFLHTFYNQALDGVPLGKAVAAGRVALRAAPDRHRGSGSINLRDWSIPIIYAKSSIRLDISRDASPEVCAPSPPMLVGRDRDYFTLERLTRGSCVVALSGLAGIGKSALAEHFASWYARTRPGTPAPLVIDLVGCSGYAALCEKLEALLGLAPSERGTPWLPELLRSTSACVLEGADYIAASWSAQPWSEDDLQKLAQALQSVSSGRTIVLLPCCSVPSFLEGIAEHEVLPLGHEDAATLLSRSTGSTGDALRSSTLKQVLRDLDGHPDCLAHADLGEIAGAHLPSRWLGAMPRARAAAAFERLSVPDREHLRLLVRCGSWIDPQVLKHLTGYFQKRRSIEVDDEDEGDEDEAVVNLKEDAQDHEDPEDDLEDKPKNALSFQPPARVEVLAFREWPALFARCQVVGLCRVEPSGMYRVHPALPELVRIDWEAVAANEFGAEWDQMCAFHHQAILATAFQLSTFMAIGTGLSDGKLRDALQLLEPTTIRQQLEIHEAALREAILFAIDNHQIPGASLGMQGLTTAWLESAEADLDFCVDLIRRLDLTGGHEILGGTGTLRLFALQHLATSNRQVAFDVCSELQRLLTSIAPSEDRHVRERRAQVSLLLGVGLDVRGQSRSAEQHVRAAIRWFEELEDRGEVARATTSLAIILRNQGRTNSSADLMNRLDASPRTFNTMALLESRHQDAVAKFDRGEVNDALEIQLANLQAAEHHPALQARVLHELGVICDETGRHADAERWFLKALAIKQAEGGGEPSSTLVALGALALRQHRLDEATDWFRQACGDRSSTVETIRQISPLLGLAKIAHLRGDHQIAVDGMLRVLGVMSHLVLPETHEGRKEMEAILLPVSPEVILERWEAVQGQPLRDRERIYVARYLLDLGGRAHADTLAAELHASSDPIVQAEALLISGLAVLNVDEDVVAEERRLRSLEKLRRAVEVLLSLSGLDASSLALLGRARTALGAVRCSSGDLPGGLQELEAAELSWRGIDHEHDVRVLWNHAHTLELLGRVQWQLGRHSEAIQAYRAEIELIRRCCAASIHFRESLIEAIFRLGEAHLASGDASAGLDMAVEAWELLLRESPGVASCAADPAAGSVMQLMVDCLMRIGQAAEVPALLLERLQVIDALVADGGPPAATEFVYLTITLLASPACRDQGVRLDRARRLAAVLELLPALDPPPPSTAAFLAEAVWQSLQDGRRDLAETLRRILAAFEVLAPRSLEPAIAGALADFDLTLGSEIALPLSDVEALVRRLQAHAGDGEDPKLMLRLAFSVSTWVARCCQEQRPDQVLAAVDELSQLVLRSAKSLDLTALYVAQCRSNLCMTLSRRREWAAAFEQLEALLRFVRDGAPASDGLPVEEGVRADPDSEEEHGLNRLVAEVPADLLSRLAEANEISMGLRAMHRVIDLAKSAPTNPLLGQAVLSSVNNFLLRVLLDAQDIRHLISRIRDLRECRSARDQLGPVFGVALMSLIFVEGRQGNLTHAHEAFRELSTMTHDRREYGALAVHAGGGLIDQLIQHDRSLECAEIFAVMAESIAGLDEVDRAIPGVCRSATRLLELYVEAREVQAGRSILDGLRRIAAAHPANMDVVMCRVIGICNLSGGTNSRGDLESMRIEFQGLITQVESDRAGELVAVFAMNLIYAGGRCNALDLSEMAYRWIEMKWKAEPDRQTAPQLVVQACDNLMSAYRAARAHPAMLDSLTTMIDDPDYARLATWAAAMAQHAAVLVRSTWRDADASTKQELTNVGKFFIRSDTSRAEFLSVLGEGLAREML